MRMRRYCRCISIAALAVAGLAPAAYGAADATPPGAPAPGFQRNSEGDEWIAPDRIATRPRAMQPDPGTEGDPVRALLPLPAAKAEEHALGLALDRARNAGPAAVLELVAGHPGTLPPLLVAARQDATRDLAADGTPTPTAPAGILRVSLNGGPCTFDAIQPAVNAAVNGDTVRLAAGAYVGNVDVSGKTITIEGGYDATCGALVAGQNATIAGVAASGSVFDVSNASTLALRNLDISGGNSFGAGIDVLGTSTVTLANTDVHNNAGASGGGVYVGGTSTVNFSADSDIYDNTGSAGAGLIVYGTLVGSDTSSDIYGNDSTTDGGGIYVSGGTLSLNNADVVANTAVGSGGGIYLTGGAIATLQNSVFVGETAPCCQTAANGAGIYASGSQVNILGASSTVLNNVATAAGGGIHLTAGSTLTMTGGSVGADVVPDSGNEAAIGGGIYADTSAIVFSGRIIANVATTTGGGIHALGGSTIDLSDASIGLESVGGTDRGNRATAGSGGGIYLAGSTLDAVNSSFRNNRAAAGDGGAIAALAGSGVAIDADFSACNPLTRLCSSLRDNTATTSLPANGNGGAIYVNASTLDLAHSYLSGNAAQRGGAVYQEGAASGVIDNTLVYANSSVVSFGAGVRVAGGIMTVTHSTLADNVGGAGYSQGTATHRIFNTIIWGNSVGAFGTLTTVSCNIDQAGVAGPATNPLFNAVGTVDGYRLGSGSPAFDACPGGLPDDLLGAPRPAGANFDMGAFEASALVFRDSFE